MLSAALVLSFVQASSAVVLPTDDVWAYPHAGDQAEDAYLRVWGTPEYAVGKPSPGSFDFSFCLLKFPSVPQAGPLKSAVLELNQTKDPAWTDEDAKQAPLEARPAPLGWNEGAWAFSQAAATVPSNEDSAILGKSGPSERLEGKEIVIRIDLLKGPAKLSVTSPFALALTSRMDPESMGEGRMYKLSSRNSPNEGLRPRLLLSW